MDVLDTVQKLIKGVANVTSNPYLFAALGVLAIVVFVLYKVFKGDMMKWFQKIQDQKNSTEVKKQKEKSQTDNDDANDQLDTILKP